MRGEAYPDAAPVVKGDGPFPRNPLALAGFWFPLLFPPDRGRLGEEGEEGGLVYLWDLYTRTFTLRPYP